MKINFLLFLVCIAFLGCQQEDSLIPQAGHYVQKASTTGWSTDDIRDFFAENKNQLESIIPDAIITDVIHGHLHAASLGDKNTNNQYVYFKSLENGEIVYACPIQN